MSDSKPDYYIQLLENVRDVTDGHYAVPQSRVSRRKPDPFGYLRRKGYISGTVGKARITFLGRVVLAARKQSNFRGEKTR